MKPYIYLIVALCLGFAIPANSEPVPEESSTAETPVAVAEANNVTYIFPIDNMIERGLVYVLRRGIQEAVEADANLIILDMHTRGGRLDACEEIIRMLMDLPENIKTCTYINRDALSAGALIALATDDIYMAPGSRIGASAPVAGGKDIESKDMKEKVVSTVIALVQDAAERNGHDENIVSAMVRKEYEYKIGDKMICPKGELLTLTASKALELVGEDKDNQRPLLSKGTVKNLDELKKILGVKNTQVLDLTVTPTEKIARMIDSYAFIFLALGAIGIYIEFKTPGFGIPGALGMVFLAIFFWGHNIAGLSGMGEVIVFLIGLLFLLAEIFIIPGFGFAGITGIILIVTSLIMAMVQHSPGLPVYKLPPLHIENALKGFGLSAICSCAVIMILIRYLPKTSMFQHIALQSALTAEEGYISSSNTDNLLGKTGIADAPLSPGGIGIFNNERLNVVTRGDFIEKGDQIVVVETHGNRIVVETVNEDQ